jgi:hypothetical protein
VSRHSSLLLLLKLPQKWGFLILACELYHDEK